ncbi:Ig-like domain-containing protein [Paenibacillus sp. OV219]|uniref:Ig-like domain-containing protein n=1 Tax=Paenibacillus sp. OV219 TaxID=1884377 RepID=UPI0008BF5EA3|nr:Ig-like domain-containing protein [Paenibacillus sp. OV219]SEN63961.1 repeat-containing protein [Paenibacillus sp. OV219]
MIRNRRWISFLIAALLVVQFAVGGLGALPQASAASSGPVMLSSSPSNNATSVAINTKLILSFDENVKKGAGSAAIQIHKQLDNAVVASFVVATDSKVVVSSTNHSIVTVTPATNVLQKNTSYYVTIDSGAFVNEGNGANYLGLTSAVDWTFATITDEDADPPVLSEAVSPLTPALGDMAGVNTPLTIVFSKPVFATSGNITITNLATASDKQSIPVNSLYVTGSGTDTITVQLPNSLKPSTADRQVSYEVRVPNGAFQDASGHKFAGIGADAWQFTTSQPALGDVSLQPPDNEFGVPIGSDLVLSFPAHVVVNQVTPAKTIKIQRISDNKLIQSISVKSSNVTTADNDMGGTDIIINPTNDLAPNTGYYVLIDSGAFIDDFESLYEGITDATTWNFTTNPGNDVTAPTLKTAREPLTTQPSTIVKLVMNFDEPVYQGRGFITIRNYPSGSVFASYDVRSSNVSGGGTATITVTGDTAQKFVNSQTYYVEIDSQAFADASGNYYSGLTGQTGWKFKVTNDSVKPLMVTQTPATSAVDVPVTGAKFELLFNEAILIANPDGITMKRISGTGNSPVATSLSIDPNNNKKLLITVTGLMAVTTNYYVEIKANAVTDVAGNSFDGILNMYQWTFKTSTSTSGAPTVSKAEMVNGNKIAITYNENLDTSTETNPAPANYFVTVNGTGRAVTGVSISGKVVTLTLQSSVSYSEIVKLSYTPGDSPVKDSTGTLAASLSNYTVTNVPDTTVPKQLEGSLTGNMITLTFSEELASVSPFSYSQFTVKVGGETRAVTQTVGAGNVMYLTYAGNTAASGLAVTLSYSSTGSYPVRDVAGNALVSFSNFTIQNGEDLRAPELKTITASGTTITLTYDEELDTSKIPLASAYYVTVGGVLRPVSYVRVSGTQVLLTLSIATTASDKVLVTYLSGTPAVVDLNGNYAPVFGSMDVNGNTGATMTLNGIIAKGGSVTATFSESLNTSYQPSTSMFEVKVNTVARPVSSAEVSGSTVVLSLYTPVAIGDTVTVSYSSSSVGIRSTSGSTAPSFSGVSAANQTTWDDNAGGDYAPAEGGGLGIMASAATTLSAVSPAGSTVNQFALSAEKVNNAYNTIRKTGGMEPKVVFTVPDTESAAMVALPLAALEDVKKATPNASFVIAYQNVTYEIPLNALNYTQLGQMMNAASAVGQLVVSIDTDAGTLATALNNKLSAANVQTLVSPVSFDLAVSSNGQTKHFDDFSGYVTRTIKTSDIVDGRQIAVVWLDPQTGKISYAPTQVTTQEDGQSVVSFKRKGNSVYAVVKGSVNYTDITKHWARNDILLLANKFIVEGNTLTTFAPNKAITRGEFAMFIAKGLGLTGDRSAAAKFKDVNTNTILAAYIGAASKAGIVQGTTDGTFKPNNPVTREEMASMMVRAASSAGVQIVPQQTTAEVLKKFTDRAKIGTWAQTDVAKAVEAGVINGMSNGAFGGKNNATRAEAAVMVKRLLNYLEFINI